MSTLELENIKHPDNSGNNIALASNGTMTVDRKSSDGDIVNYRKDGTTVGGIGTLSGDLVIHSSESGHKGLRFGNGAIVPMANSHSGGSDNNCNLGGATSRFNELYLSGGVFLGGTGTANKLDDYEEGTYSPTYVGAGNAGSTAYSDQQGRYVKIGTFCRVWFDITISSSSGMSGQPRLSLPFTSAGGFYDMGAMTPWAIVDAFTNGRTPTQWITQGVPYMMMYTWTGDSAQGHAAFNVNATGRIAGSCSYTTA